VFERDRERVEIVTAVVVRFLCILDDGVGGKGARCMPQRRRRAMASGSGSARRGR